MVSDARSGTSGFGRPAAAPGLACAFQFVADLRAAPNYVPLQEGVRHWSIFRDLCLSVGAKGNIVPDAYLAALAIEAGCELASADRGVARFPGLRWRHPLDPPATGRYR